MRQSKRPPAPPPELRRKLRLPALGQVGFVVRDTEATARYYEETFGIGPWAILEGDTVECTNRGRPVTIRGRIGLAQVGGVQFELIQILEGETIHLEFLQGHGEGLHHLGFFIRDLDARLRACEQCGIEVLQRGTLKQAGVNINYAYLETTAVGGVIFEYIEQRIGPLPVRPPAWMMKVFARIDARNRRR